MLVGIVCSVIALLVLDIDWLKPRPPKHILEAIERNRWRP